MHPINNWLLRFLSCTFLCMIVSFGIKPASAVQVPTLGACFELGDIFDPTQTKDYDCDGKTSNLNYSVYVNQDLSLSGYGICSTDGAPTYNVGDIGNPASTTGVNCWCTLDGYSITGAGQGGSGNLANAVLINTDYKNSSDCNAQCGCECAGRVADASIAIQLYGLKDINNQFCTCPPLADFYTNYDCRNMRVDNKSTSGSNWTITFRDGTSVTGTSLCSITDGMTPHTPGVPSETQTGDYCWCRATSFNDGTNTTNATDSSWYYVDGITNCSTSACAAGCSGILQDLINNGNCTFLENLSFCPEENTCASLTSIFNQIDPKFTMSAKVPPVIIIEGSGDSTIGTFSINGKTSSTIGSTPGQTSSTISTTSGNYCWCNISEYNTGTAVSGSLSNWYYSGSSGSYYTDAACTGDCWSKFRDDLSNGGDLLSMMGDDFCPDNTTPNGYTITYSCNGGTGTPPVDSFSYNNGSWAVAQGVGGCSRQNYTFDHWSCNGNSVYFTEPFQITGNTTCTAQWEPYKTVTYSCGAGTGNPPTDSNSPYPKNTYVTILGNTCTPPTGKRFTWYTDSNVSGIHRTPGGQFQITSNTTLTAQYGNEYNVTYDCGDATGTAPSSEIATYGLDFTPAYPTNCSKTGYQFAGWAVSGTNDIVAKTFTYNYSADKTLTAQWTETKFSIETTNLPSTSKTFEFRMSASGTFYVDCGEGGILSGNSAASGIIDRNWIVANTYACTYESGGVKTIKFGGTATDYRTDAVAAISFNTSSINGAKIASISGDLSAMFPYITGNAPDGAQPNFKNTFRHASITSIPSTLFQNYTTASVDMFYYTFADCASLTTIPANLFFPNASSVSGTEHLFYRTFDSCTSLTSIPTGLFAKVTSSAPSLFSSTFEGCTSLTSIPSNLFFSNASSVSGADNMFYSTFEGCTSLTSIPTGLFAKVTSGAPSLFSSTFRNCTSLTSAGIPSNLFFPNASSVSGEERMFMYTFGGCTSLTTIPTGLFAKITSGATYLFYGTFFGCTSLTSIPSNLFFPNATSVSGAEYMFSNTFANCTSLTSIPSDLFFSNNVQSVSGAYYMFSNTFANCTSLTSIPENLFAKITSTGTSMFYRTFLGCTNLGCATAGCSTGTGYIPPSTFAGLIANDSTKTTNMWSGAFDNTKLVTTCPTGTVQYTTGYEGNNSYTTWNGKVSCYNCNAGYYANNNECTQCPSEYPSSPNNNTGDITSCYRSCTTNDVANSTAVTGDYHSGGSNNCAATACAANTYLNNGACTGCPTAYPNSAAGSTSINDCYVTLSAGYEVASAGAGKTACAGGKYNTSTANIYYGGNVSGRATTNTCSNITAGYYCAGGAKTATPSSTSDSVTGAACGNCASANGANGRMQYSTAGAASCSECPAISGTLTSRMTSYSGWWSNNIHNSIGGCAVNFTDDDPDSTNVVWCMYSTTDSGYGGTTSYCQTRQPTACAAGKYSTIQSTNEWVNDGAGYAQCNGVDCMKGKVCTNTTAGYYSANGATTQTACDAGYYSSAGAASCTAINGGYWNDGCGTNATGSVCDNNHHGGTINAGYFSSGGGTSATPTTVGNGCVTGQTCGTIAAGRYGAAGATTAQGAGAVSAGYFSTGGATSATPSSSDCVASNTCGICTSGYSTGGATTASCTACPGSMTATGTTAADHNEKADCKITCTAGQYLEKNTSACANCPAGKYCSSSGTYGFNASNDQGITGNITAGYYCSGGCSTATGTTCPTGYSCGNCASSNGANGRMQYSDAGAASCSECPAVTGTLASRVVSYSGWWGQGNPLHDRISGCTANFNDNDSDATFTTMCYYNNAVDGYGGSSSCYIYKSRVTACAAGKYLTLESTSEYSSSAGYAHCYGVDCMNGKVCTDTTAGYYSADGALTQTQCGDGNYSSAGAASCTACTTTSGWATHTTSTTATTYSACYQTRTPSGCASGNTKRTASSISGTTITYGTETVENALSASGGHKVSGTTCPECGDGSYYAGGTATSCTACTTTSGWATHTTSTTATAYSACYQTRTPSGCASGNTKRTASSISGTTITYGTETVENALSASGGHKVSGITCPECGDGSYYAGGTATSCTACPTRTDTTWTVHTTSTTASAYSACYETKPASSVSSYCHTGQLSRTADSANSWGTATSTLTAKQGSIITGTGNNTTCSQCTGATYMASADGHSNTSCTACPTPNDHKRTTFPSNYYGGNAVESSNAVSKTGSTAITQCEVQNWVTGTRGRLNEHATYNTTTEKYDVYMWHKWTGANAGYYLLTPDSCGSYAYYQDAAACESGSYCPGKATTECNSSNQSTVWTTTFGKESCSSLTGVSPTGGTYTSDGNRDAKTSCLYTAPSGKTISGCKTVTSQAVRYTSNNTWPASTYGVTANKGHIILNNNQSNASCPECTSGTFMATDGNTATSCTTCPTGYSGSDGGFDAQTDCYKSCSNTTVAHATPTSVAPVNAKEYYTGSAYPSCTYNPSCDTGYTATNGASPVCNANTNTITLNGNGATGGKIKNNAMTSGAVTFTCTTASDMSLPTWSATDSASTTSIVLTDKKFLGWSTSDSCTTSSCVASVTTCPTGNTTYYAVWQSKTNACTACSTATTTTNTANCSLSISNNACAYTTSCKGGYGTLSGSGTSAPSCTQCSAGTASANNNNTCTVCGNNKWSAAGASSCSDCQSGYTNSGDSATNHANNSSCKITVTAGHYIDASGQNSSNWKTCAAGTAKAQHTVSYGSTSPNSACDACTGATYSDTTGAGSCTTCPAAVQYASIVNSYDYWTENGVHNTIYGCRAVFNEQDSTGDYALSCSYSSQGDYGTGGGDRACMAGHVTSCAGGRYAPYENLGGNVVWTSSIATMYGSVCVDAGTGYYSANGSTSRTLCPENYRSGAAASSQSGCSTTCNAGYAVLSANGACTTIQNSTYKGKWIGANTVTYGSTSTINNCPTNYQSANGTTAQSNCETTCAAGTQVASANAACSTPTGTNWYTSEHNVKYGLTSGTNVKTCATGYKTANTSTATDHDNQNDCKIGCDAGYYIPTAGQGCQSCPSGKYCSAISNISETATSAATGNITAGYYCAGGAKTATPSSTSDSATGASCGACASPNFSNAGASSCTACSTLGYPTGFSSGTFSSTGSHNANTTCRFTAPDKSKPSSCDTISKNAVAYSGSAWGTNFYTVTTVAGYYITANNNANPSCATASNGYYVATTNATSQSQCPEGFRAGSDTVRDSAAKCYRSCTASDVGGSTAVTGKFYNRTTNPNQCSATACGSGTYLDNNACTACSDLGGGLYTNSANGNNTGSSACYVTTTAGSYVAASTDTTQTTCPAYKYCESVDLYYPNVGDPDNANTVNDGIKSCPATDSSTARTAPYPSEYQNPTNQVSFALNNSTGINSIQNCRAAYTYDNAAGRITVSGARYSSTSGKYDRTVGAVYYTKLNAGYYAQNKYYTAEQCNTTDPTAQNRYMYYTEAQPCPTGSYCPGLNSMPKCGTGTYNDIIGLNTCPTAYPNSAANSTSINDCYVTLSAGYEVASAGAGKTACAGGKYNNSTANIYYGGTVSGRSTTSTCSNITAGYYCAGGAKTATPSSTSDSATGASCGKCTTDTTTGRKAYSTAGASSCTACPTVSTSSSLSGRVQQYGGWWSNDIHNSINGCYALFSASDTTATFNILCYYNSTDGAYGGTHSYCQVYDSYVSACPAGKYKTLQNAQEWNSNASYSLCYGIDCMNGKVCTNTTAGYYSTDGDMTQTACANGSYSSAGSSSCTPCAGGKKNTGTGNSSCNDDCASIPNLATWETPSWNSNNNTVNNLCTVKTCQTCTNGTGAQGCASTITNNACVYTATCKSGYSTNGDTNTGTSATCNGSTCTCDANTISLIWYDEDGSTPASGVSAEAESCIYGEGITLPENPTKPGYRFIGWTVM